MLSKIRPKNRKKTYMWYHTSFNTLLYIPHSKSTEQSRINHYYTCDDPSLATRGSASVTATAFIQLSDLLHCIHSLDVRCRVDLRWKLCFEGTADEMLEHSEKGMTWKCWCLTVHSLPSFPQICVHIHYSWIQTELSNLHYVASCVIAIAFSSLCNSVCVFISVLLYNKCCIYSPGMNIWVLK